MSRGPAFSASFNSWWDAIPVGVRGASVVSGEYTNTHSDLYAIFSPSDARIIETNQPNACNQCHTQKPVGWTIGHLEVWFGAKFHGRQIAANYLDSNAPAPLKWLENKNQAVRLVAVDSRPRRNDRSALPQLIDALDDSDLLNRQFARIGLERMLDLKLSEFGYQFYMTPDERREPLRRLRDKLLQ